VKEVEFDGLELDETRRIWAGEEYSFPLEVTTDCLLRRHEAK
jgi:hypothetical protein